MMSIFLLAPVAALTTFVPLPVVRRSLAISVRTLASSVILGLLTTLLLLGTITAVSIRYTADVLPAFTLLGSLTLLHWTAAYRHTAVRSATLIGAVGAWIVSLIFGLMLGVGAWQYVYPVQAQQVAMTAHAALARLSTVLPNEAVRSWTQPRGPTTWRHDRYYLKDRSIYLRVPEPGTSLIVDVSSELPAGTELVVKVDHQPALRQSLQPGSQTVQTPSLPGLAAGTVVPIHLELSGHEEQAPGSRIALKVNGLDFTRNGRPTNPLSLDVVLRREVEALWGEKQQLEEEAQRAGAEFDRLKSAVEAARVAVGSEETHPDRPRLAEQERLLKQQRRILDDAERRLKDSERLFRERYAELQRNEAEIRSARR